MSESQKAFWKEPGDVRALTAHTDPRGFLFEVLRFESQGVPGTGQLYAFSIEPGQRRGDHYHTRKREWFTCVHGEARVLLTDTATGEDRVVLLSAREPSIVYCGPGLAHALVNETDSTSVIVSYGSEEFHPEDPDTFPFRACPGNA